MQLELSAAAIFGKDHDIGVVPPQRVGNSEEPGSAALPDVLGEQPHSPDFTRFRGSADRPW
jgi:hypothetical protein